VATHNPVAGLTVTFIRTSDGKYMVKYAGNTREGVKEFITVHDDFASISKRLEAVLTLGDVLPVS
jgi:hypothetical protein